MRLSARVVLLLAWVLASCGADPTANDVTDNVQNDIKQANDVDALALPTISEPLSRRSLLLAAAEATSDFAAGLDDTERQRALDGQPFSLAIRLCEGDTGGAMTRSTLNEESRVLRFEVRPDLDASSALVQQLSPAGTEAVEGFWIARPWLLKPACPTIALAAPATEQPSTEVREAPSTEMMHEQSEGRPQSVPRVGIAEFHDLTSDRSSRRGNRAYEVTKRLPAGTRVGPVDLVIQGRLRALPAGKVIVCTGGSATMPPSCIISARVDAVSLRQTSGEVLGQWSGS